MRPAVDSVAECLERIARFDGRLHAFITVLSETAMAEARVLDSEREAGRLRGALHGMPVAIKDNIDTCGVRTTAASALFLDRTPETDAEVVRRLKAAGAIVIGKTNMQEFGLGSTSVDSHFGPVLNPWDMERYAGGSSGGSACAVAAGMAQAALGTDTGGSVRTPAAYCGVVGLKPTYGVTPMGGIIPAKQSLDHCGPIARTVAEAASLHDVLAGTRTVLGPVGMLRVGVPRDPFFEELDAPVAVAVERAIRTIAHLTESVRDVQLPPTDSISLAGETFAYHQQFWKQRPDAYTAHARRAIEIDSQASLAGYIQSRWRLEQLRREIDGAFAECDVVVLPTRRKMPETVAEYLERDALGGSVAENTGAFNIYGVPAVSIPCGFSSDGLPVGLTIAGPRHSEARILSLALAYERATEWHQAVPPLASAR